MILYYILGINVINAIIIDSSMRSKDLYLVPGHTFTSCPATETMLFRIAMAQMPADYARALA